MNVLEKFSVYMNKDKNFLKNILIKFFRCFNFIDEPAKESFIIEHYYILVYLIMSFKDFMNITQDEVLSIIYTLYALIIDDNGSCTNLNYDAIDSDNILEFSNKTLQISILLSEKIFTICKNDNFYILWKEKLKNIFNGDEFFTEKQYSLKEINTILNKSILNGDR